VTRAPAPDEVSDTRDGSRSACATHFRLTSVEESSRLGRGLCIWAGQDGELLGEWWLVRAGEAAGLDRQAGAARWTVQIRSGWVVGGLSFPLQPLNY
jgi:hypothetical protein